MRFIKTSALAALGGMALVYAMSAAAQQATAGMPGAAYGSAPASFSTPVSQAYVTLPGAPGGTQASVPTAPPAVTEPQVNLKAMTPSTKVIQVFPGKQVTATISQRFPNRIITPFKNPVIGAGSDVNLDVHGQGSVVYATVKRPNGQPIAFYLMERGNEDSAIPLMLTPADVGMVDLRLVGNELAQQPEAQAVDTKAAEHWETASSFTATITGFMRRVAAGKVPPGYGFRKASASDEFPACHLAGITITPRQVMTGRNLTGYVSLATNITKRPIEIDESACGSPDVVGVAAWPNVLLQPGQSTEVYVLRSNTRRETGGQERPSALGVAQ